MWYDKYRITGNGRSKWMKRGGGVGILIRKDLKLEIDELNVGNCMINEDILARREKYMLGKKQK